jgi:hypothetical protein
VDPDVPSPARVWNVWLGGTDNFPADRELAGRIQAAMPATPPATWSPRPPPR